MDVVQAYHQYGAAMIRHARLLLKSDQRAEDAVQDALERALRGAPAFASSEHEKAWLLAVTGNICRDYLRRAWWRRETPLPEDFDVPGPDSTEQIVTQRERDEALLRAVMNLPVKYREAVLLVYYHDLSNQAAADALGISGTAFRSRLMRARDMLRANLGEEIEM